MSLGDSRPPDHFTTPPDHISEREHLDRAHERHMDFYAGLTERRVVLILTLLEKKTTSNIEQQRTPRSAPVDTGVSLAAEL